MLAHPLVLPTPMQLPLLAAAASGVVPRHPAPCCLAQRDPELQAKIEAMQQRNQRRGAVVLGTVVALCIWLFSVPPDIRRANICGLSGDSIFSDCVPLPTLANRVAEHYQSCGGEGTPACVQFDFSIDPRKREAFDRTVDALFESSAPGAE